MSDEIDLFAKSVVELPQIPVPDVKNPIKISYSKAQAFKSCEQKFKYAHVELHVNDPKKPGLMPKEKAVALARGTFGHAVMERACKEVMTHSFPYSQEVCVTAINNAIAWGLTQPDSQYMPDIMHQMMHWFANVLPVNGWRILASEQEIMLPVGHDDVSGRDVVYPGTVDLIFEINGRIYVADFKFSADEYSDDRVEIEPQIPQYIGVLRALNVPVVSGWYVFFRTRKYIKDINDRVKVKPVRPNDFRIKQSFKEHLSTTGKIINAQNNPNWEPTRNAGNNCDYCDFKKLCQIELRGDDASLKKEYDFVANDYGYEDL